MAFEHALLVAQGLYYLVTGAWPLVAIDSFQKVTGPKIDLWLVKTVGLLITVIAIALLMAGLREELSLEILLLAIASQLALSAIDIIYVARRVISRIYLADAVAELILFLLWATWIGSSVLT